MSLIKNVCTFPLFKTGVCSVEYRVACRFLLQWRSIWEKKNKNGKETEKEKRKASKEGRDLGAYVRIVHSVFSWRRALGGCRREKEGWTDRQGDTLASLMPWLICSGRDRSPVKGLEMCLLGLLLELNWLEPQPQVFQKSLCLDGDAERKKDTWKINSVIYLGEGQQSWTVYLKRRRQGGDENWDT